MSNEEDYLSDKFLVEAASSSQPKTYTQRRHESLKQSLIKNEQNRLKSRRQREQEFREDGLRKSLFERAKEDDEGKNKALGIMLKMGFKIGDSLGQKGDLPAHEAISPPGRSRNETEEPSEPSKRRNVSPGSTHITEPLPLNEWSGKRGIGLGKRARSLNAAGRLERLEKMAKMAEDAGTENFRDFNRQGYEERRAGAHLTRAQRTCISLDEMAGISFNVLWIDLNDVDSIPKGLMDVLLQCTESISPAPSGRDNEATRLRDQMRADALQPVASDDDSSASNDHNEINKATQQEDFPAEMLEEAVYFLRLGPRNRLSLVLAYLRDRYAYCFWCGTKYEGGGDLDQHCPGPNEDDHD